MTHRLEFPWIQVLRRCSPDRRVDLAVFAKPDAAVEATLTRTPGIADRLIVSCSTMCGCPIGCRFCGAGEFFARNLTADEIVGQVVGLLEEGAPARGVADPGALLIRLDRMGEPTLNRAIAPALLNLAERYPQALQLFCTSAPSVPWDWLFELGRLLPRLDVQFSLHESTDHARNLRIPFPKKLGLRAIADLGAAWRDHTGRAVGFNYCAHAGNTSAADADRLAALFEPATWSATVSVTFETAAATSDGLTHPATFAQEFAGKLSARGFPTEFFHPQGAGLLGAGPGQLWHAQLWARSNPGRLCRRAVSRSFRSASPP
jgi:23S rRNA (adenine2503-C2)-methyltransferase